MPEIIVDKWIEYGVLGLCVITLCFTVIGLFHWATSKQTKLEETHLSRYDLLVKKYDDERNALQLRHEQEMRNFDDKARAERRILQEESNTRTDAVTAVLNEIKIAIIKSNLGK